MSGRMSSKQLRWIRENQGLSEEEFSEKLNIEVDDYKKFEERRAIIPEQLEKAVVKAVWKTK